jgi:pimeloyl-ACP methyl ester carboxylesterase
MYDAAIICPPLRSNHVQLLARCMKKFTKLETFRPFHRSWRIVAPMFLALFLMACSGSTERPAASSTAAPSQAAATSTAKPSTTPGPGDVVYDGQIAVGGDRELEVRCVGVGSPTILLEGGGTDPTLDEYPRAFVNELGKTTTTCQYSHAGAGTSTPLPGTRTMAAVVSDAYALLAALKEKAGVPGPYVFVGWSFGGAVALADALAHPDQTKGLVILDTDFIVDFVKTCLASGRAKADCQKEYDDDIDAKSLETELVKTIHPLPGVPLRIVSALQFPECDPANPDSLHVSISGRDVTAKDCATLATKIADLQQQGWSAVNPKLKQTLVDANHDGLIDQAGDQIKAIILDVVEAARTNR